jgi:hypothetical protein
MTNAQEGKKQKAQQKTVQFEPLGGLPKFNLPPKSKGEVTKDYMQALHLSFTPTDKLSMIYKDITLKYLRYPHMPGHVRWLDPKLSAKDNSFAAYFEFQPWNDYTKKAPPIPPYFDQMKFDLAVCLNKEKDELTEKEFQNSVHRFTTEEAKAFNADLVMYYDLHNLKDEPLKEYKVGRVYVVRKNKYGYFMLYCFYMDESAENIKSYEVELTKALKFSD